MRLAALIEEGSSDPNLSLALKVRIRTVRGLESSDTTARDNAKFGSELSGPRKVRIRTFRAHWKFGSKVACIHLVRVKSRATDVGTLAGPIAEAPANM